MGNSFWKNFFREIRDNPGRFLSIMLIVMLGVAFFSGVRASEPDMRGSMDLFVRTHDYQDIRVLSTWGLTEGDVEAIREVKGVTRAEGGYDTHVYCDHDKQTSVLEVMSIADDMNAFKLDEGMMPMATDECIMDAKIASEWGKGVGDLIQIRSDSDDLKSKTFRIVGIGRYPGYLSDDRDSSSLGSGEVAGFIAVSKATFNMEAYTVVFARADGLNKLSTYDTEYKRQIRKIKSDIEGIAEERLDIRSDEMTQELKDGQAEIQDGQSELASGESQLLSGEQKLRSSRAQIRSGRAELNAQKQQTEQTLAANQAQIDSGRAQIAQGEQSYQTNLAQLTAQKTALEQQIAAATSEEERAPLEAALAQVMGGLAQLETGHQQLLAQQAQLDAAQQQVNAGREQAAQQFAAAEQQLKAGEAEIAKGEAEIRKNRTKLGNARRDLAEAQRKIADGWDEISDLGEGKWYVLGRLDNQGYAEYDENASRIGAIGRVFPIIFFLIAALVSLTAMTRMVEEQRSQIGLMEALGYSNKIILLKFAGYCLLATVTGSIIGVLFGEKLFPFVIITAYRDQFVNMDASTIPYVWKYAWMAGGAAILCNLVASLGACGHLMMSEPAQLMRPVAPKNGSRILLERITPIWKRLKFSRKATLRNIFRYKKRLLMTIIGIGGCTGMILTGFGINDAVMTMSDQQYSTIWSYDMQLNVSSSASDEALADLDAELADRSVVRTSMDAYEENAEVASVKGGRYRDITMIVPVDPSAIEPFIHLHERESGEKLVLADDSVVISEKMARLLGISKGDTMKLRLDGGTDAEVRIGGVTENYLLHYLYVSPELYGKIAGSKPASNTVFLKYSGKPGQKGLPKDEDKLAEQFLKLDAVDQVVLSSEASKSMDKMTRLMGVVVGLLTGAAGLLAFIVIYNLNNIAITERRRELATLKVLGFFDEEVSMYVYRENIILTGLSIIVGLFFGTAMEKFIMQTAETDSLMFGQTIEPLSFVLAAIFTVLFAAIVNGVSYFSLKKIDMIESLKSVE